MKKDEAEKLLRQSAEAARTLLPSYMERRGEIFAQLMALDKEIQRFKLIIGDAPSDPPASVPAVTTSARGKVESLVLETLRGSKESLSNDQIRQIILEQKNIPLGKSTVYAVLAKLNKDDFVRGRNGKWTVGERR